MPHDLGYKLVNLEHEQAMNFKKDAIFVKCDHLCCFPYFYRRIIFLASSALPASFSKKYLQKSGRGH
jgi:hypothetical protein